MLSTGILVHTSLRKRNPQSHLDVKHSGTTMDRYRQNKMCLMSLNILLNTDFFLYVLLTVHLSIILVTDQLNAQILVL